MQKSYDELYDPIGQQQPGCQMQQRFIVQDRHDGKQRKSHYSYESQSIHNYFIFNHVLFYLFFIYARFVRARIHRFSYTSGKWVGIRATRQGFGQKKNAPSACGFFCPNSYSLAGCGPPITFVYENRWIGRTFYYPTSC